MFLKNIKIAFRNILKDKFHSSINILGLSVSLAACILISFYIKFELNYDSHILKKERIVSVNSVFNVRGKVVNQAITQPVLADELKRSIPEIKYATKIKEEHIFIQNDKNQMVRTNVFFTDSDFLKMFVADESLKHSGGLKEKNNIILTESIARKFFNSRNVEGEVLSVKVSNQIEEYKVTAVIDDFPENSSFQFDVLISIDKLRDYYSENYFTSWGMFSTYCYLEVHSPEMITSLDEKINNTLKGLINAESMNYDTVPFEDLHWNNDVHASIGSTSNLLYIQFAITVGILILIIAVINFANLNFSKLGLKLKDVAVNKVLGASKIRLIINYLSESILVSYTALICGLILTELFLPGFNVIVQKNFQFTDIINTEMLTGLMLLPIVIAFLSGIIPAITITRYTPNDTFKNKIKLNSNNLFNKGLMTVQFSISLILLIISVYMNNQIDYLKEYNTGVDEDQVLVVNLDGSDSKKIVEQFKNTETNGILEVASSNFCPGYGLNGTVIHQQDNRIQVNVGRVDENLIPLLGLNLKQGRNFELNRNDNKESILINKKLADLLNNNFTGLTTKWGGLRNCNVIGVLEDFNFESLHSDLGPMMLYINKDYKQSYMFLKLAGNDIPQSIKNAEILWNENDPNQPFNYFFLDETFEKLYKSEQAWLEFLTVSSLFSIILALSGLFSFASFAITKRLKEITIRKIVGAKASDIIILLSRDYLGVIILSAIISIPVARWLADKWLESFAYKIPLNFSVALISFLTLLFLVQTIIYLKSYKAYLINPVKTLRDE